MSDSKKQKKMFILDYYKIGERIRFYRESKMLKQNYVASKIGISNSHMSNIETGKTKPSLEIICAISRVLEVTIDELLINDTITQNYKKQKLYETADEFDMRIFEDLKESIDKNLKYLKKDWGKNENSGMRW